MKKKWLIKAAMAAGMMYASTGSAWAVCGTNGETGTYSGVFYTWFTDNGYNNNGGYGGNDCLYFTDVSQRKVRADWDLEDGGQDAVGGIGYPKGWTSGFVDFNVTGNSAWAVNGNDGKGTKAYGALYGWSCNGSQIQEYYVVENSAEGYFRPWDNGINAEANLVTNQTIDGANYRLYITRQPKAAHACGSGQTEFYQYWSVRDGNRWQGTISLAPHMNAWAANGRGFYKPGVTNGYQVYGIEGVINSRGSAEWTMRRRSR